MTLYRKLTQYLQQCLFKMPLFLNSVLIQMKKKKQSHHPENTGHGLNKKFRGNLVQMADMYRKYSVFLRVEGRKKQ